MKKIVLFLMGFALMLMTCVMLVMTSVMYDSGRAFTVAPYFFQPDNLPENRPGAPRAIGEFVDGRIRDMLIKKFVTEYFYVTPDVQNIENRMNGANPTLAYMSDRDVFQQWKTGVGKQIQTMAQNNMMRSVRVVGEILNTTDNDGYWVAQYELQTWSHPNILDEAPEISRGQMIMRVSYEPGLWPDAPLEWILDNLDPAVAFQFRVLSVEIHAE